MKGDLTNWKVCWIKKKLLELKNYGQALSAAFENPSNHTNDDLGKVEELMQVFKEYCNRLLVWSGWHSAKHSVCLTYNKGDITSIQMSLLGAWQLKRIRTLHIFDSLFVYSFQFQKSRIPFLSKKPRKIETADIKNASLIICFEKSTYENIHKGRFIIWW